MSPGRDPSEGPTNDLPDADEGRAQLDRLLSAWPIAAAFLTGTVYYTLTRAHASYLAEFGLGPSTFSHSIFELAARDLLTLLLVIFFCVVSIAINRLIIGDSLYRKLDGAADWTTTWLTATPGRRKISLPIAVALMPVLTLSLVVIVADLTGGGRAQGLKARYKEHCANCWSYADKSGKHITTGSPIDQDSNHVAILTSTGTILVKLDDVGVIRKGVAKKESCEAKATPIKNTKSDGKTERSTAAPSMPSPK